MKKLTKKKLEDNTTIVKKVSGEEKLIQEGKELPRKVDKPNSGNTVGLNIGVTLNLGDYQSLRIDCWASEELQEGQDRQEKLIELTNMLQEHIYYVSDEMQDKE